MSKIVAHKMVGRKTAAKGAFVETHEVELDGLPAVSVDIKVSKTLANMKDAEKKAKKITTLVEKEARAQIRDLEAAHAG